MLNETVLRTDGGEGVEIEIIVTGETILMTGLEGAGRILLTRGPVAEVMVTLENLQADPKASKPPRSVHIPPHISSHLLIHLCRQRNNLPRQHRLRLKRRQSA
jgi:hypothetical protein